MSDRTQPNLTEAIQAHRNQYAALAVEVCRLRAQREELDAQLEKMQHQMTDVAGVIAGLEAAQRMVQEQQENPDGAV